MITVKSFLTTVILLVTIAKVCLTVIILACYHRHSLFDGGQEIMDHRQKMLDGGPTIQDHR
ncbi:MAG TPA: hypothetical protein VGG06_33370 [Thermoanaerobaculia bacterium]|jgi:hypothetical protein